MLRSKKPLIIAHRGASALAPENTLSAFRKAVEDGAEGIEFDVRLAKDEVPVVFHDARLKRITARVGKINDFTSQEIGTFDAGSWFNRKMPKKAKAEFGRETVPLLNQVLELLKGFRGLIYIELKCLESEMAPLVKAVCGEISRSPLFSQIIVKSFNLKAIPAARFLLPEIKTAALFAPKIFDVPRRETQLLKITREIGADQISMHYSLASERLLRQAAKENIPIAVWTVNSPAWIRRALHLEIDVLITNNPARLLAKRREFLR